MEGWEDACTVPKGQAAAMIRHAAQLPSEFDGFALDVWLSASPINQSHAASNTSKAPTIQGWPIEGSNRGRHLNAMA